MVIYAGGRKKEKHLLSQDKGQKSEVGLFIEAIVEGKPPLANSFQRDVQRLW